MTRLLALLLLLPAARASESVAYYQDAFPGPRFAGLYIAADHGFYRDAGVDLAVHAFAFGMDMPARIEGSPAAAAGSGTAIRVLRGRAAGADLVVIGTVLSESPEGLLSLGGTPPAAADLPGRRGAAATAARRG